MKINIFIKILIPFFLLFVSVASVWFLVFVPFSAEVQEYKNNRTLLSEVEQKAGLKGNLRKEFNKISQQAKLIDSAFIEEANVLEFIETLESIAVLTSNTYDTDVLQEIKDNSGNLVSINITMALGGSFSNLLNFFREIKKQPYLINFAQTSIENNDGILTTRATIQVYIR